MTGRKILIIEDDQKTVRLLEQYLGGFGYEVYSSLEPLTGIEMIATRKPDLVILDIMLPHIDVSISRLRKKLKAAKDGPSYIKTIWGAGYKFVADE